MEFRGSIAFFTTYRPPVPLDIFSCPVPPLSTTDELHLTDGAKSSNYNCQIIPLAALKTIINRPKLASEATEADVDSGRLTGMIFVSERGNHLETVHIALRRKSKSSVWPISMAPIHSKVFGWKTVAALAVVIRWEVTLLIISSSTYPLRSLHKIVVPPGLLYTKPIL